MYIAFYYNAGLANWTASSWDFLGWDVNSMQVFLYAT